VSNFQISRRQPLPTRAGRERTGGREEERAADLGRRRRRGCGVQREVFALDAPSDGGSAEASSGQLPDQTTGREHEENLFFIFILL
jgi:hypothetical protein